MEHRWGNRVQIDLPVRLRLHNGTTVAARLVDLSVSGALIRMSAPYRLLGELDVLIGDESVPAWVVRHAGHAVGLEWLDFAPEAVHALLAAALAARGTRVDFNPPRPLPMITT